MLHFLKEKQHQTVEENAMARYAIISDMHSSTGYIMEEAEVLATRFGKWLLGPFYRSMKEEIKDHHHVRSTLERIKQGGYDGIIGLGDYSQTGEAEEAEEAMDLLNQYSKGAPLYLAPGNHDIKSWVKFGDRWSEYLSEEQIDSYKKIFGPLYGAKELKGNVILIWLMSEPFMFQWHKHDHLSSRQYRLLNNILKAQLQFLQETLNCKQWVDKKIILSLHDPGALLSSHLKGALWQHRNRILLTLTGHIHAGWLMRIMCLVHPILWPKLLWQMRRYKAWLIPSVWGIALPDTFWMAGAGWAELDISDSGNKLLFHFTNSKKIRGFRL